MQNERCERLLLHRMQVLLEKIKKDVRHLYAKTFSVADEYMRGGEKWQGGHTKSLWHIARCCNRRHRYFKWAVFEPKYVHLPFKSKIFRTFLQNSRSNTFVGTFYASHFNGRAERHLFL